MVWSIAQRLAQDLSYGILPRNPAEKLVISHGRSSKDGYHIYRVPPTEIARVHIARCEAGDMQAIKELANRLDGRPAQILEHSGPDSEPIGRIVREIVHVNVSPEEISAAEDEPVLIDWRPRRYVRPGSCARAASGHAAAAPPSSVMKSRRFIQ